MKVHKNYLGVKIYKVKQMIPGSNLKELANGTFKECKPKFTTAYYYAEMSSYPYDTLQECIDAIEWVKNECVHYNCYNPTTFKETMNTKE